MIVPYVLSIKPNAAVAPLPALAVSTKSLSVVLSTELSKYTSPRVAVTTPVEDTVMLVSVSALPLVASEPRSPIVTAAFTAVRVKLVSESTSAMSPIVTVADVVELETVKVSKASVSPMSPVDSVRADVEPVTVSAVVSVSSRSTPLNVEVAAPALRVTDAASVMVVVPPPAPIVPPDKTDKLAEATVSSVTYISVSDIVTAVPVGIDARLTTAFAAVASKHLGHHGQ